MNKCKNCKHFKAVYTPYIKRHVMICDLPERNSACQGSYERKNTENKVKGESECYMK